MSRRGLRLFRVGLLATTAGATAALLVASPAAPADTTAPLVILSLGALGVPRSALPALLTVALAHGTAEERRQACALGSPQAARAPLHGPLLERLGPGLEAAA